MHALAKLKTLLDSFWLIAVPLFDTAGTIDRNNIIPFAYTTRLHNVNRLPTHN
jgi:hypothetical protein